MSSLREEAQEFIENLDIEAQGRKVAQYILDVYGAEGHEAAYELWDLVCKDYQLVWLVHPHIEALLKQMQLDRRHAPAVSRPDVICKMPPAEKHSFGDLDDEAYERPI